MIDRGLYQHASELMATPGRSRFLLAVVTGNPDSKHLSTSCLVLNYPLRALAHLGLVRAFQSSGALQNSRQAYLDFLSLWKSADPDIPILKQAKAEYAKLQ